MRPGIPLTITLLAGALSTVSAGGAVAADYLTVVEAGPYTVEAGKAEILTRAKRCANQLLSSGRLGGQPVLSVDDDALVANNVIQQPVTMDTWDLKTKLMLEAREGRFKITHTDIAWFITPNGWMPVGKWWGSDWRGVQANLTRESTRLAECVQKRAGSDDW